MPTPKAILLHLDNSDHTQRRVQAARDVASAFDAQVTAQYCVTPGMQLYPMAFTSGAVGAAMLEDIDDERRRNAQAAFAVTVSAQRPIGRTVLVAWKETREATRAVAAAIPWLGGANAVHLACYSDESGTQLQALAARLKARVITAKLHRGGPEGGEGGDAGENLLSLAMDVGADLLVMGCYGRGRAGEWILGGVTRTILQSMTLPVLMVQ